MAKIPVPEDADPHTWVSAWADALPGLKAPGPPTPTQAEQAVPAADVDRWRLDAVWPRLSVADRARLADLAERLAQPEPRTRR
jgi:hypothetical protein